MTPYDAPSAPVPTTPKAPLIDALGRTIDYVRVSVTDRCDLRCVYCMAERQTFLPKAEVLTIEELDRLCSAFIARGGIGSRHSRRRMPASDSASPNGRSPVEKK